ncbi:unnamed protein product [Paramecium sonneborni]|uniref:WD40-repeat-containing domain n=1 Tax=Paramecium sonneborni TaxID=65129 RepID=A0A8S1QLA6_9CILI|nr:unnamed protein product [Paramecium sonneborni]
MLINLMQQISDIQCHEHLEKIQFLDLRQKILKGERAKCCKCQLFNPTYIEQALQEWMKKKQNEIQLLENEYQGYLIPLKIFQEQMTQIKKQFIQNIEHLINQTNQLINGINYDKNNKIKTLQNYDEKVTLSILQEMAQLISESSSILKRSKSDMELYQKLKQLNDLAKQIRTEQEKSVVNIMKQQQQFREKIVNFKELYLKNTQKFRFKEIKNINNVKQYEVCRVITFNRDDTIMLAGCNFNIKVWNFNNGRIKEDQTLIGHVDDVISLTFSLNQNLFVSGGSWKDKKIIIWIKSIDKWKISQILDSHQGFVPQLLLNQNDSELISCSQDKKIIIWNYQTIDNLWKLKQELTNHKDIIYGISLSSTENCLISCSQDQSVIVWKKRNNIWEQFQQIKHNYYAFRISFLDDDSFIFQLNIEGFLRLYQQKQDGEFQENIEMRMYVQDLEDPWLLFPSVYNIEKKILIQKQNKFVNIFINQGNGMLIKGDTIQCQSHQNNGGLSKNGRFVVIWDSSPIMEGDGVIKIFEILYQNIV